MNDDKDNETSCFWLPSEFFTDDDFLPEKLTPNKNTTVSDSTNCSWAMSTSPQSTLAHYRSWAGSSNGSPQGVNSPPNTPFLHQNDAVRDLIDKAANQVATLNLTHSFGHGLTKNNNFMGPHNSQFQRSERVMGQGGWTVHQDPTRFLTGSGSVKRKCAGTGVFLPRVIRNETSNGSYVSDSRNKPGYSLGLVPADRHANHVLSQSQLVSQPQFNQNYDLLMARRNLIIAQRRALLIAERSLMMNRNMYLPQEWTY